MLKACRRICRTYLEHTSKYQQKSAESAEKGYARAMRKARDENQLLLSENMDLRQDKKALAHQVQMVRGARALDAGLCFA